MNLNSPALQKKNVLKRLDIELKNHQYTLNVNMFRQYVYQQVIPSTVDIVIGRVAQVHIDDKVILDNGKLDIQSIRPIARLDIMTIQ